MLRVRDGKLSIASRVDLTCNQCSCTREVGLGYWLRKHNIRIRELRADLTKQDSVDLCQSCSTTEMHKVMSPEERISRVTKQRAALIKKGTLRPKLCMICKMPVEAKRNTPDSRLLTNKICNSAKCREIHKASRAKAARARWIGSKNPRYNHNPELKPKRKRQKARVNEQG